MTSSSLLLFVALLSISTAKFHCSEDAPHRCTPSSVTLEEYQIYCPTEKSIRAGFNVTLLPSKYVDVQCKNSAHRTEFITNGKLDLGEVESMTFAGCQLPSAEYIDRLSAGVNSVKSLTVEKLKGAGDVSKQQVDAVPALKLLDLSNNHNGEVDADLLHGLRNLTGLNLRATPIRIPPGFFAASRSLTHLDLGQIVASNPKPGLFDNLESQHDNSTADSHQFVQEDKLAAIADYPEVVCDDNDDEGKNPLWQSFVDFTELLARGFGAFLISLAILCLFFLVLLKILASFLHHAAASTTPSKFREYDAFVSHCDDERDFVTSELAARLETGSRPYRLCVRERDWTRSTNVANVVEKSSRAIVVVSRDFFHQRARCLEYELARDRGCQMIFVVRGEFEDQMSVRTLKAMTPVDRWIEWGDERFWEKLFRAMATRR